MPNFRRTNQANGHDGFWPTSRVPGRISHRIFESDSLPHNVNRLSVFVQSSGKKCLILDLRFINKHFWKQSVKVEDLKVALNYLDPGHFLFSFDI